MKILAILLLISVLTMLILLVLPSTKGWAGEMLVRLLLRKYSKQGAVVFNDLYFYNGRRSCQIDHLVISPKGIFVIETKNYLGIIAGRWTDNKILRNVLGKCYWMKNPVMQNDYHIRYLLENIPGMKQYASALKSVILFVLSSEVKYYDNPAALGYTVELTTPLNLSKIIERGPYYLTASDIHHIANSISSHNRR